MLAIHMWEWLFWRFDNGRKAIVSEKTFDWFLWLGFALRLVSCHCWSGRPDCVRFRWFRPHGQGYRRNWPLRRTSKSASSKWSVCNGAITSLQVSPFGATLPARMTNIHKPPRHHYHYCAIVWMSMFCVRQTKRKFRLHSPLLSSSSSCAWFASHLMVMKRFKCMVGELGLYHPQVYDLQQNNASVYGAGCSVSNSKVSVASPLWSA